MFASLGRWCYRRRIVVVVLWVVAFVGFGAASGAVGSGFSSEFDLPDVESSRGFDTLEAYYGGQGSGIQGQVVFRAEQGVDDPAVQAAMTAFFEEIAAIPDVTLVSPYAPEGQGQIATQGAEAGKIAYATIEMPRDTPIEDVASVGSEIEDLAPAIDGLDVEVGGAEFAEFEPPSSEILGLAFAIVILILAFGSVLAMGLPIGTALAGIGAGTAIVTLLSNLVKMPDFTSIIGIMIGLGVGIDYALFIVTRFREGLHHGHSISQSVVTAMDTAGRAVTFAGITVVISLSGMWLMGVAFIQGLATGAALTVAATLIASLTLLPALVGFAGSRVEVTRWRGLVAAGLVALALVGVGLGIGPLVVFGVGGAVLAILASFAVAPLRREVPRRAPKPIRETAAYRWSRVIQHHPWPAALVGAGILVLAALPVLALRLGFSDEGNFAEDTTTRQAYDLLAEGFGPGFNGPLIVAAELPDGTDPAALAGVTDALSATQGVAFASSAIPDDPADPQAVIWRIIPTTAPQDAATADLVGTLRDDVLPTATAGTGVEVAVTGGVAAEIDFSDFLAARTPLFFGVVLALSFLLLMVVFRSLLVPLKAVVMNLLSIGAAYGLVVALFQWGWGGDLLGITPGPIEPFIPMMMFAIVFGLSMDYEVFLLSRVREEWLRTGDSHTSVSDGLAATARVITAAAAIMVFIFGSFLLENDRIVKVFGVGLAAAIALDASVVRMLLVPATMELLGDRNWWLPRWLDRLLPTIDVEGPTEAVEEELEQVLEPESVTAGR